MESVTVVGVWHVGLVPICYKYFGRAQEFPKHGNGGEIKRIAASQWWIVVEEDAAIWNWLGGGGNQWTRIARQKDIPEESWWQFIVFADIYETIS